MEPFVPFPKIPRWSRNIIITEKLDGTNASIFIEQQASPQEIPGALNVEVDGLHFVVAAGSRKRWIQPQNDNYGFAKWVWANAQELARVLGPGHHFGEWWGAGIQRGYNTGEKRFSLFNTERWNGLPFLRALNLEVSPLLYRVPVLYNGIMSEQAVETALETLRTKGSLASPGFMAAEGVVIFHVAGNVLFKKTLVGDESPKGAQE